jgi:hypothetical protein
MSQRQRKEFHPEFFKNTLKIHFGKSNFTRKDAVQGLKLVADLKNIDNICQYKSRKIWYIAFVDSFKSSELIYEEVVIKKNKFTFEPFFFFYFKTKKKKKSLIFSNSLY